MLSENLVLVYLCSSFCGIKVDSSREQFFIDGVGFTEIYKNDYFIIQN